MMLKQLLFRLNAYQYISAITGFALLTYELIASRLLAPTIGSSIYVWTSVIGVIIAALSLGYSVGGKLADRRVEPQDVSWLLMASAFGVISTIVTTDSTLSVITNTIGDPRMQGLIASLLLFAPTSFVIGAISPYLARLTVKSVKTSGSTVASLSTLNAIGSISGTFCTGFIFMAYVGSLETLTVVSFILLASSWLIQPKKNTHKRLMVTAVLALFISLTYGLHANNKADITVNTSTASYRIVDTFYNNQATRVLMSGPGGYQSGVYLDGDRSLVFDYTQQLANVVEAAPKKDRILILGGGAYTLPEYLARAYPQSQIDVVELDGKLADISKEYFNYQPQPNIADFHQDARAFLNQTDRQYDVILVDVFSDSLIPFSVSTAEYARQIAKASTSDGIVAVNFIGSNRGACGTLLGSMQNSYTQQFAYGKILPLRDSSLSSNQNIIMAFSQKTLSMLNQDWINPVTTSGPELRDNFAPVEHLKAQCEQA